MKITTSIRMLRGSTLAVAAGTTMLAGCAAGPNANPADPIEPFNREIFRINENLGKDVLRPVARTYVDVAPLPARTAISNFFSNTDDVYSVVNSLLQLKSAAALEDTMHVVINTVLDLGDLIDIASGAGLPKRKEDFGQTLGVWGIPPDPYVMWPLLDPSAACDTMGSLVNWQMDPLTYWHDSAITHSLAALRVVDVCVSLFRASNVFKQATVNEYTFLRDTYLQRHRYLIYDGNLPEDQDNTKSPDTGNATVPPYHRFTPNWPVFCR